MGRAFLLTFDLEEFALPLEYGKHIDEEEAFSVSYEGCKRIINILKKFKIKSTFFTNPEFALRFPKLIKNMSTSGHEIALHHFFNIKNNLEKDKKRVKEGKGTLEEMCGCSVKGFRGHLLKILPFNFLKKVGFTYDSSIHPTFVPGRYNRLKHSRSSHFIDGLIEIPISVTPIFRLPFSFVWFRNLGLRYAKVCTTISNFDQNFINMYFHPWEFVNLEKYDLPFYMKRNCGNFFEKKLKEYLKWCLSKGLRFSTIRDYIETNDILCGLKPTVSHESFQA